MRIIKRIHSYAVQFIRQIKIYFDFLLLRSFTKVKTVNDNSFRRNLGRVLVIAPHADDELIGTYGLCKKENVIGIICLNMGYNNTLCSNIREREFIQYVSSIGKPSYIINNSQECIETIINKLQPDTIALPSYIDWHKDHKLSNIEVANACIQLNIAPTILWYQVSVPISLSCVNNSSIFTKAQHKKKWKTFKRYYKSQKSLPVYRFALWEKFNASGSYAEEVYFVMNSEQHLKIISLLSDNQGLDDLKTSINNIREIHVKSERLYSLNQNSERS